MSDSRLLNTFFLHRFDKFADVEDVAANLKTVVEVA